jgi:hypothetical protein
LYSFDLWLADENPNWSDNKGLGVFSAGGGARSVSRGGELNDDTAGAMGENEEAGEPK